MFIKSVSIPATDQARALKFYTEKLGFMLKLDVPCPTTGQRWIALTHPGSSVELVIYTGPDFKDMVGKGMNIMYSTDDVKKTYETLKAKGVEFLSEPQTESWGTYVMMKDSEGNTFCVGQENQSCSA